MKRVPAFCLAVAASVSSARPAPPTPTAAAPAELTIAVAGDSLPFFSREAIEGTRGWQSIGSLLRSATVAITNLNGACCTEHGVPREEDPILLGTSSSEAPDALKALGFDLVSLATDHTMDLSEAGMLATRAAFKHAGVATAGSGRDSAEAGAATYLRTAAGVIGFIGVYLGPTRSVNATAARSDIAGRPGANLVRVDERIQLDPATFAALRKALDSTRIPWLSTSGDEIELIDDTLKRGEKTSVDYVVNRNDLARLVGEVKRARFFSSFVVVSVHSRMLDVADNVPSPGFTKVARALVDAGAGAVVGHGLHQLRGVEIYNGAPIFYDVGNFTKAFDGSPQPSTVYERYGQPIDGSLDKLYEVMLLPWAKKLPVWDGAIFTLHVDNKGVREIDLSPIDLGVGLDYRAMGYPRAASAERGAQILDRFAKMSAPLGTTVIIKNGVGVVKLR